MHTVKQTNNKMCVCVCVLQWESPGSHVGMNAGRGGSAAHNS